MKKKILALTLALCASLSAAAIPVSAEVETKSAAIANIDMSWPYIKADNKAATKAMNSDLRACRVKVFKLDLTFMASV